jgi:hypothetical protein
VVASKSQASKVAANAEVASILWRSHIPVVKPGFFYAMAVRWLLIHRKHRGRSIGDTPHETSSQAQSEILVETSRRQGKNQAHKIKADAQNKKPV